MEIERLAQTDILETYKKKKTPDGRRDCIRQLAAKHNLAVRTVAEFLLSQGCQVDGRLIQKTAKTHAVNPALGPELPGWDGPEEVVEETDEGEQEDGRSPPETSAPARWTVETLRDLLAGVAGKGEVFLGDGVPVGRVKVVADFGPDGERSSCAVYLYE